MHPFFDEKEYLAGAYENNIFVLKVSKNELNIVEAKRFISQHDDNIKLLSWQNKQNGYLASSSTDKVINLYDIRSHRNPVHRVKDDDICKSMKFSNTNPTNFATGYEKRIKIWDFKKSMTHPVLQKQIFQHSVDIIDWHSSMNHLLAGSKRENLLKIFSVKENELNFLMEIKIKDPTENFENSNRLIKSYFIPGNSVIAVCERKALIYHLDFNYSEVNLDQVIEFENIIVNFKSMTNNLNNHYFVYSDIKNNFTTRMYTFSEITLNKSMIANSITFEKKHLYTKEIENVKILIFRLKNVILTT
jgi:WD40 repeat protein